MSEPRLEDLWVVGTTTPVERDDLPARLAPIYRSTDGRYYLPIESDTPGEIAFDHADETWVNLQEKEGELLLFATHIRAEPDHVLLQSNASSPPEYFPEAKLRDRLDELGGKALHDAALALHAGDRGAAEEYAWYASRAVPSKPLPLLVLRALLRDEIPSDHLAYLEKDIEAFSDEERTRALIGIDEDLRPLLELVQKDIAGPLIPKRETAPRPRVEPRPRYLRSFANNANLLPEARRLMDSRRSYP